MTSPSRVWWTRAGVVLGLVALTLALRFPFLGVPLERDEGEYAYIAWLVDHGGAPYADAFNQKPPGTFYAYWAVMKLFGFTVAGIHLGAALWCAATAGFVFLIGKRLYGAGAGWIGAALFTVMAISPGVLGTAANTEMFMALPLAAAAFLAAVFVTGGGSWPIAFACGALAGAALCFKQVAVTDGAFFLGVVAATTYRRRGTRAAALGAAAFVAGAASVVAALLVLLAAQGALAEFVKDTVGVNAGYLEIVPPSLYPVRLLAVMRNELVPFMGSHLALGLAGAVVAAWRRDEPAVNRWFLPGWLAAAFAGVIPGGMFREHYFFQVLAPLALAGSVALLAATRPIRWPALRVATCAAVVAIPLVTGFRPYLGMSADDVSKALYPGSPFVESKAVAAVVAGNTGPDDRVLVFGSEPQILFYAQRRSASRYILTYPLMMNVPGAADRQVEMTREIDAARPAVIVVVSDPMSHLAGPWSSQVALDHLKPVLAQEYALIYPPRGSGAPRGKIGVYRRRG